MSNRVMHDVMKMTDGSLVQIEYWANGQEIHLAGFRREGKQVTSAVYSAKVDIADDFHTAFRDSVIESLTRTIRYDLEHNPELHYRP